MNKEQIKGVTRDIAGQVQEDIGKLTNSPDQQIAGLKNQIQGKTEQIIGKVKQVLTGTTTKTTKP